jgi:hypothetical protein
VPLPTAQANLGASIAAFPGLFAAAGFGPMQSDCAGHPADAPGSVIGGQSFTTGLR